MEHGGRTARFGPFDFDLERLVLRRDGVPVHLPPQPARVLACLLRHPGDLVTRDELKEALWRDRVVEFDTGLNFSVRQVREALGDTAAAPAYVGTVHRRGYRFIAPVSWSVKAEPVAWARRVGVGFVLVGLVAIVLPLGLGSGRDRQREISRLGASLPEPSRTAFAAAQWLYEQGELDRALARVDSVRLREPDFSGGWALTAQIHHGLGRLREAQAAAERAVALDAENAEGWYALGLAHFMDLRENGALEAFSTAVQLEPARIRYRQWYAQALANLLRFDGAIRQLEAARDIDPLANIVGADLAGVYLAAGRYADAVSFCTASLELVPDNERWARDCLLTAHHLRGEADEAVDQARALMLLDGSSAEDGHSVVSVRDYFRWDLARIDRITEELPSPFLRVRALARLQDREGALRGLVALREARHFSVQWAPRDPWFRFLHGDPDFEALLTEAGLPVPAPIDIP